MFDLNIGMVSSNSPHKDKKKGTLAMKEAEDHQEGSGTNTELSGSSSTSSVVNVDESPVSGAGEHDFFRRDSFPVVTHQLFPMTDVVADDGGRGESEVVEVMSIGSSSQQQQQWLKLSVSGSGSGVGPEVPKQQVRRSRRGPRSRSSQYRGVTFYRRTGRWESHIWDCGKQVYLGGFDTAHAAARAYDRAAIKFRGVDADINFSNADYDEDMKQMKNLGKEEFVHILRRQSTGFARGSSRYRGVTLHKCGRWEARMGQFLGKKAYDKAAIQCNGREAVTNFDPTTYVPMQPSHNELGGGGDHNLDLNLGISITIDGPKGSNHLGVANGKKPVSGSSAYYTTAAPGMTVTPFHGQPLTSTQSTSPIMWSAFLPPPSAAYQEHGKNEKKEGMSSERFSSWAWYAQNQGLGGGGGGGGGGSSKQVQVQQLLSNTNSSAASSGFSSSSSASYNYNNTFSLANPERISNHHPATTTNTNTNTSSFHPYAQDR